MEERAKMAARERRNEELKNGAQYGEPVGRPVGPRLRDLEGLKGLGKRDPYDEVIAEERSRMEERAKMAARERRNEELKNGAQYGEPVGRPVGPRLRDLEGLKGLGKRDPYDEVIAEERSRMEERAKMAARERRNEELKNGAQYGEPVGRPVGPRLRDLEGLKGRPPFGKQI